MHHVWRRLLPSRLPSPSLLRSSAAALSTQGAERAARLFTPGPLTTSDAVRAALTRDLGSRAPEMVKCIKDVRSELLEMAHVSQDAGYECVLMQGSGTFAVESVISSVVAPTTGRLLVWSNGAYGRRIIQIAERHGVAYGAITRSEREAIAPECVEEELRRAAASEGELPYTHVVIVHHETTSGILNPMHEVGMAVKRAAPQAAYIVDSMSAFGAYEVDMVRSNVSYMVSSANKLIEGVPGFAFAICNRERLLAEGGAARTVALDVLEQWRGLEGNGQFRFTPPTHALLAFRQALSEHAEEGGPAGRLARYEANAKVLIDGLAELGFTPYLSPALMGAVISTFEYPDDPLFDFETFYLDLAARGLVIYPGKLTETECFRIGSIGRLYPSDMRDLVDAVGEVLRARGVTVPVTQLKQ